MKKVKNIGIILESKDDILDINAENAFNHYHWREAKEIEKIRSSIEDLGFKSIIIGNPYDYVQKFNSLDTKVDFILNLSVGFEKRFRLALAPSLYELIEIPYSGADPYSKMVSQNKLLMKSFLDKINIPTPAWTYVGVNSNLDSIAIPEFPVIIKPSYEGSSIGINKNAVVNNYDEMISNIKYIRENLNMPSIIEKFIVGKELKVGIIGNMEKKFIGIIEDVFENGNSLNDEFIYFDRKTFRPLKKVRRNLDEYKKLVDNCLEIYDHFVPLDYGAFDIRVDNNNNHYFLEFNADATLHYERTLAKCCELNNLNYNSMIRLILNSAFERWDIERIEDND